MSFSDDPASPAAPFSGDETGQIFEAPDLVLESPTTSERFVETQSGFLVVVKHQDEKQALSVKRRLGTPPASSVLLTPDEAVKLSRILGDSGTYRGKAVLATHSEAKHSAAEDSEEESAAERLGARRRHKPTERSIEEWLASETGLSLSRGRVDGRWKHLLRGVVLPVFLSVLLGVAIAYLAQSARLPGHRILVSAQGDPFDAKRLDTFLRGFVLNLLDFNRNTYRTSQVRAMAQMSPELLESYWSDTHFPLSTRQLRALPEGTSIEVQLVTPKKLDTTHASADVYANLINAKTGARSPIHLILQLQLDADGNLRVTGQKDVTGATPGGACPARG